MNVLVVDDDVAIRRVLGVALGVQDNVATVRVVESGDAALRIDDDFVPDVVVLDFSMPGMTAEDAAAELRRRYPDARIIVYSGVLEEKPEWADQHVVKGDLPDLDSL